MNLKLKKSKITASFPDRGAFYFDGWIVLCDDVDTGITIFRLDTNDQFSHFKGYGVSVTNYGGLSPLPYDAPTKQKAIEAVKHLLVASADWKTLPVTENGAIDFTPDQMAHVYAARRCVN